MLYLGVSNTHEAQRDILEALTRKFRLDPGLSLQELSERCPFNYTGADFYALCSDAMLNAMTRKAEETDAVIGTTCSSSYKSQADLGQLQLKSTRLRQCPIHIHTR